MTTIRRILAADPDTIVTTASIIAAIACAVILTVWG